MAATQESRREEESAPGPAAWLVTFCDCMTLLLCFFVMLMSFSSFDSEALRRVAGFLQSRSYGWIFPVRHEIKGSLVPEVDRPVDPTRQGSEKPTDWERQLVKFPRRPLEITEIDAFQDRKVLYIPQERLFYGKGCVLRPEGREYLQRIASFLKLVPCRVVVSEASPAEDGARSEAALERAWAVMEQFVEGERLAADRFSLSVSQAAPAARFGGKSLIQIELLAWNVYR